MQQEVYYDDEIDLREIIQTLLKGWRVILLMTVFVGVVAFVYSKLETPIYEATATIFVDQKNLALKSSPVSLLGSDEVYQLVADRLEIPVGSLPFAIIVNDKIDTTLFTITVQSEDAQQATNAVNAWADVGLELIGAQLQRASIYLSVENANFEKTDRVFVNYLREHKLSAWTWVDLSILTGVANSGNFSAQSYSQGLPEISDKERLEVAQLMRVRVIAEQAYNIVLEQSILTAYAVDATPPMVHNYAITPTKAINQKIMMHTALGLILGGILGVFWVFVSGWWQSDNADETNEEDK